MFIIWHNTNWENDNLQDDNLYLLLRKKLGEAFWLYCVFYID